VPSPKIIRIYDADAAAPESRVDDLRSRIEKRNRTLPTLVKKGPAGRAWTTKEVPEPMRPYRPLLAYVLGPLSGLVTPAGRMSRIWTLLAVLSAAGWVAGVRFAGPLWELVRKGSPLGMGGALTAGALLLVGFLAWARGLVLATPRSSSLPQKGWSTWPWLVASLGVLAPGLGLSLVGRSRRAAAALLSAGFVVLCVGIVTHASSLWQGTARMAALRPALEWTFLLAGIGILLGTLAWVMLALEGVRLVPGPKRVATRWGRWGDVFAVALLGSVIAFALLFRPTLLAKQLDESGVSLGANGYRVLPGFCFRGAMRLDPSQSVYVLHAAELAEAIGDDVAARAFRRELDQRIEPVVGKEGMRKLAGGSTSPRAGVVLPPGVIPGAGSALPGSQSMGPRVHTNQDPAPWEVVPGRTGNPKGP